nr:immunoglobulin heavy chain junction region [Mus musculus]
CARVKGPVPGSSPWYFDVW